MADNDNRRDLHITNNFNAPIGQHIDHVDTLNFSMDGDGTFHFGMVENVKRQDSKPHEETTDQLTPLVHYEVAEDSDQWAIHNELKRLVAHQGLQDICQQLNKMAAANKIMQPMSAEKAYNELVRLGMPDGEGYSLKTFMKYYKK